MLIIDEIAHRIVFAFYYWRRAIKRHLVLSFFILVGVYLFIVGLQLLYPPTLALPNTRIAGEYYGFKSQDKIASSISEKTESTISIDLTYQKVNTKLKDAGVEVNGMSTAEGATHYSLLQRLIPLSIFKKVNSDLTFRIDEEKLETFANSLSSYDKKAVEPSVRFESGVAKPVYGTNGYSYSIEEAKKLIKAGHYKKGLAIAIKPTTINPVADSKDADEAADTANNRVKKTLNITAAGQTLVVDKAKFTDWMVFVIDPINKKIVVTYSRDKIKADLLNKMQAYVYIAETKNRVTITDGEQSAVVSGTPGRALNVEDSIDAIINAASANESKVNAILQDITPETQIIRKYTRTSKGLQTLIDYWVQNHKGKYGVALRNVPGTITASNNGDKQFTSASIYKMYLAYGIYTKVSAGTLSLSSLTNTGKTVGQCIDPMIVVSDNTCAIALGNMVGWSKIDYLFKDKGYSLTTLNTGYHLTTANNTTNMLYDLYSGNLIEDSYKETLLGYMKKQIYRKGIPAGSQGVVADKVGFLGSLNHDAAIVYSPKETYILTVMTDGSSFTTISDLAKQISDVMNQ